jgi:hypothetical protein
MARDAARAECRLPDRGLQHENESMGFFDFFKGKGGSARGGAADERALMRHAERVMDKRAMSPDRFASIEFLCRLGTAEAWRALLPRFNFNVDPGITDREEKYYIVEAITGNPEHAVEPLREYLRSGQSINWAIKLLREILSPEDFVAEMVDYLRTFDTGYEKNFDRKLQLIMSLEDVPDPRVTAAVLPFLEDFTEDVRFHAVRTLLAQNDEAAARGPLLALLLRDDSVRIRTTVVEGLADRGWAIEPEQRDRVAQLLQTVPTGPWVVSKDQKITRPTRL